MTRLVHGQEGLAAAERISQALFAGSLGALGESDVLQLRQDGLPATTLARAELPETLTQMLSDAEMAASGKQIKDALGRQAVTVNECVLSMDDNASTGVVFDAARAIFGRFYLVKLGKKKYHLFEVV